MLRDKRMDFRALGVGEPWQTRHDSGVHHLAQESKRRGSENQLRPASPFVAYRLSATF